MKKTAFSAMYPFVKWLRYIKNVIGRIIPENSFLFRQLVLLGLQLTVKQRLAKPPMLNLQIPVTMHCNLSCVCCSAFSTLAEEEFCDVVVYESDLKRIAEITDAKLGFLAFAGGEPLLHPQLTDMFDVARRCFPDSLLLVQTNGLLLKKQPESFWTNCAKNGVEIEITKYPIKLDTQTLFELGQIHNVKVEYFGGKTEPIKSMWKFPLDLNGHLDPEKNFRLCPTANRYGFLHKGKVGCNKAITIGAFNAHFSQDLAVCEEDFIDIYTVSTCDEILEYLRHPIPFCRYCDWQNLKTGIKWSVSKKEISEWV